MHYFFGLQIQLQDKIISFYSQIFKVYLSLFYITQHLYFKIINFYYSKKLDFIIFLKNKLLYFLA